MKPNRTLHVTADWTLKLECVCPYCEQFVDLLDYADFWDGHPIDACEHGTERSKELEVVCPDCGRDFTVECQY